MTHGNRLERERCFHDAWAETASLDKICIEQYSNSPVSMEIQYILKQLGCMRGKRVLDVGSGLGESSVMFATLGAEVTAADISEEMLSATARLAQRFGVQVEPMHIVRGLEDAPDEAYDLIFAANVLHHVADKRHFLREARRALRQGGVLCCWDPVKYNPLINVYRMLATKVRTDDEDPIGRKDVNLIRAEFDQVRCSFFWLLSLSLFIKYFIIDRVHPNADRYWKRIYQETPRSLRWWMPLSRLDGILCRLPGLRWLSWNIVVLAKK